MPTRHTPPSSSSSSSSSSSPSSSFPTPSPRSPPLPPLPSPPSSTIATLKPSPSSSSSFPSPKPPLPSPPSSSTTSKFQPTPTPSSSTSTVLQTSSSPLISSASSSLRTKTSFYVRVMTGHPGHGEIFSHWYSLDDKKKKKKKEEEDSLPPPPLFVPEPEPEKHLLSKAAVLGSRFYVIGGLERPTHTFGKGVPSPDVFYQEAHRLGEDWKRGPSLLRPRSDPYVTVANGKIYVFGGNYVGDDPPWGEIFDPVLNQWLPLDPSTEIPFTVSAHAQLDNDTFLIHTPYSEQLFHLNVANGSSGVYSQKPFGNFWGGTVLLSGLLYFAHTRLWAYDLETKEWYKSSVEGLDQEGVLPPDLGFWDITPSLYDLGRGRVGLIWAQSIEYGKINIKLSTFGIKKQGSRLVAHSLCHYNHFIQGTFTLDCVKSFPFEEKSGNKNNNGEKKSKRNKKNKKKKKNTTAHLQ